MSRTYAALDLIWSGNVDEDFLSLLLAEIDDVGPTAVEESDHHARVFFSAETDRDRAASRLRAFAPDVSCQPVDVPDEDWAARSQASLGPVQIGRIVVAPPWAVDRNGGRSGNATSVPVLTVTIRPSMGFGTAHHASTRLCLRLLQELPIAGSHVIDLGTGSGVLAIAAARLGAARVLAIDHDPDALQSARENVELNGVAEIVSLMQMDVAAPPATSPKPPADVLIANLTGALLVRLAPALREMVTSEGHVVVSGILGDEADAVTHAFEDAGLCVEQRLDEDEWVAFEFRPRGEP